MTIDRDLEQEFPTDRQVECSSNANWPEETNKSRLKLVLNLVDILVHRKDDWDSAHKKYQNPQKDKTVYRDYVVVRK